MKAVNEALVTRDTFLRILYMIDDFGHLTDEEREGMEKQLPGYLKENSEKS